MHRILLLDDETGILSALRRMLRTRDVVLDDKRYPLRVDAFADPLEAIDRLEQDIRYDLLLSDYRMPVMDGVAFLSRARELQPDAVRMILSGYADMHGLIGAINEAKIFRFIAKPWDDYELLEAIGKGLAYRDRERENRALADQALVGRGELSPQEHAMRELEAQMPGITRVKWGPDGSVILDDDSLNDDGH